MGSAPTVHSPLDHAASVFAGLRPRLFGIAYRVLGSAAEAEDVVQDAWLRWQSTDRSVVLDPPAFLITTTARLAINVAQSARARRETYLGPCLPEPVDTSADPALGAERGEALELAVLLLLEKLPPTERAAYVLSEAFDYPYAEIADMLETSEANARQLSSRARKHLTTERRDPVSPAEQRRLLEAFLAAARNGDLGALESLFTSQVVSYSDGGGAVRAARKPVVGARRMARFLAAVARWLWRDATLVEVEANGRAAFLIERGGCPVRSAHRQGVPPRHRPDILGDEPGQAHRDRPVFTSDEALTLCRSPAASRNGARRGPWLRTGRGTCAAASLATDRYSSHGGRNNMKAALLFSLLLGVIPVLAADPKVTTLMTKPLPDFPGKEVLMITVDYPPGGSDPIHRHNAHAFLYVLEGSVVMAVEGGKPVTLTPGQTFYEGPTDVHNHRAQREPDAAGQVPGAPAQG